LIEFETGTVYVRRAKGGQEATHPLLGDELRALRELNPGQVRIRVHAATVNPTDVATRNGTRAEQQKADPPPYVPGMEAPGIVDEVGSGVPDRLKLGNAVVAIVVPNGSHGAYREQIVLDARSVVRAPAGKTHPEAATLPRNGLTARLSLDLLKLSPGEVIAVTGAAGAYGGYVIQLAKAEGLTVIADASEKDEKLVESLGADIVIRRGDDVASRIRGHFPQGVDGLADGAVLNELVIPAVRDGGAFTSVRGFQGIPQRDIHFTATFVRSYAQEFEKLDRLRQQVEAGKITLRLAEVYPPERAADPQRFFTHGQRRMGDRHVYAQRTRFIPNSVSDHFESRSWPTPKSASKGSGRTREPVDVRAKMRRMWANEAL
jgi:NADPH:quinone reductase